MGDASGLEIWNQRFHGVIPIYSSSSRICSEGLIILKTDLGVHLPVDIFVFAAFPVK